MQVASPGFESTANIPQRARRRLRPLGHIRPPRKREVTLIAFKYTKTCKIAERGEEREEETRSGTEKRCSHNLQSGHKAVIPGGGQRIIAVFFPQ